MQRYSEFRPTQFDPRGLSLDEQQEWLVLPVAQNRDSGPLEQSNFAVALESLGGESDVVQVHRFGHWANGWFEIIIVDPADKRAVTIAEDIERALEDYPVLDDSDFSEREHEDFLQSWSSFGASDFRRTLRAMVWQSKADDLIDGTSDDEMLEFWRELDGEYYSESSGVCIRYPEVTRGELAAFLLSLKRKEAVGG